MKSKDRPTLVALLVSLAVTLALLASAFVVSGFNATLARILYWQGYWLQSLVPTSNIGTAEHPLLEANPVHVLAFFAGIPFGWFIYFFVALVLTRRYFGRVVAQQVVPLDVPATASRRQGRE